MNTAAVFSLLFLLLPELAFACPRHSIALDGLLKSSGTIFLNLGLLLTLTIFLGFAAGRTVRRLSPAGKLTILTLVTAGLLLTAGGRSSWACHGAKVVDPILKEIYAAQLTYHQKHEVYAASFEELGMVPASNQYSYFLPSETLSAVNPLPKDGVDLSRLPEGVLPFASADKFTVVVLAFAEPDRIDVWTMDQAKVFKEWSVPALSRAKNQPQKDEPVSWRGTFDRIMNTLEGPLTWMTLLLGLAIGFNLARRASPMPRLASL